ncbi:glycosyltransferase family 9 protein [Selenomonas noxia]|uniref:glycosyltransferase family 9 protein n=1 Tax=Selenomonas noxia TaxID=135083 RepID=UPI00031F8750|nr:glycosyltransferase family 9 protein [Selenomonas noxia]
MRWLKQVLRQVNYFCQYCIVKALQVRTRKNIWCEQDLKWPQGCFSSILVIRLDEIGDMVMMSPFLRELRQNYPSAHITLVVNPIVYNLVELCPYVNKVLCFSRIGGRFSFYVNLWRGGVFSYRYLKKEDYELALVPRFDADAGYGAGMLAFLSGAKKRVGYSECVLPHKMISDKGYDGFYTRLLFSKTAAVFHEVERNLNVLRYIDGYIADDSLEVWFDDADRNKCRGMLSSLGDVEVKIVLSISSGSPKREWPAEKFIELVKELTPFNIAWVIVGAGERAVTNARKIEEVCPFVANLVNQTTLRETAAIIDACDIYLGGDTGLMHIAAALKKTGVVISCHPIGADEDHANSPKRFGPWKSPMQIVRPKALPGCEHGCNREDAHCIREISVEDVKRQVLLLL